MKESRKFKPKGSLKSKILIITLPCLIIMVISMIVMAYGVSKNSLLKSSTELLNTSAKDQVHQIESWLDQKLNEVKTVKYDIENTDALSDNEKLQGIIDKYENLDSDFRSGFYISDTSGNIMKAADSTAESKKLDQPWYKEGLTRVNMGYTDLYENENNEKIISVSGMLNDFQNIRVLATDMNIDSVNIIVNSSVSMSNAESILVDKNDGSILVARDENLIMTNIKDSSDTLLKEISGNIADRDYNVIKISGNYCVMKEITGTDWLLVSYIPIKYITASIDNLRNMMIVVAVILLSIVVVVLYTTVNYSLKPLKDITNKIKLMSEGDFTIDVVQKSKDEIGEMQLNVGIFIESMRNMIGEITEISGKMREQADTSNEIAENMLSSSKKQVESMNDLNETMHTFSISVSDIAHDAAELTGVVSDTTGDSNDIKDRIGVMVGVSKKGKEDMQHIIDAMSGIKASMENLVEAINKVGNASKEIIGIVSLIGDISEETALLSLNASIEAARAGESGKGFAVVASEISKLADSTAKSVGNIDQLIAEVELLINAAISQADLSVDEINASSEKIQIAVDTFDEIYVSVNDIEKEICEIAEKIQKVSNVASGVSSVYEQQTETTDIVYNTSQDMVEQANDFEIQSEKVAEGAKILTQTSDKLTQYMDKFKVSK